MPEETMEVAPSAEQGNVPVDTPDSTPSETPTTEVTPSEVTPTTPEVELFELPDGRKVDAGTLATEWKTNFAPEFTRKSQELAQLKTQIPATPTPAPQTNRYADPEYVPTSYAEIIEAAKTEMLQELEQREQARVEQQQAIESAVVAQLEQVKSLDPNVNENQLFLHANKYGFRDLTLAHQNMKDMASMVKTVQKTTTENIQKRQDPVSIQPGSGSTGVNPSAFSSARDFLRSIKS